MSLRFNFFRLLSLPVLALAGLASCKSAQALFPVTPTARISQRLPALEITADPGPLAMNDGALPDDPLKMFQQEMQKNLAEPTDTATFGYARLVVNQVKTSRTGRSLQAAQVATMMMPSVLGAPLEWYTTNIQADVQVMNASGELLGTYSGKGSSKVKVAMYHGYSQTEAPRLADVLALHEALNQIRPQLDSAARRLRPLLLAGGQVANPTLPAAAQAGRAAREQAAAARAAAQDRLLAEKALANKAAADKLAADKAAADKTLADQKAAEQATADKLAAEKAAAANQASAQAAAKASARPQPAARKAASKKSTAVRQPLKKASVSRRPAGRKVTARR